MAKVERRTMSHLHGWNREAYLAYRESGAEIELMCLSQEKCNIDALKDIETYTCFVDALDQTEVYVVGFIYSTFNKKWGANNFTILGICNNLDDAKSRLQHEVLLYCRGRLEDFNLNTFFIKKVPVI